jgi:hypothetical protein
VTTTEPERPGRSVGGPAPVDWACAVLAVAVLTAFAFLLVTGRYLADGPVLFALAKKHGVHEGDLFVATCWVLGVVAVVLLTLRRRRG